MRHYEAVSGNPPAKMCNDRAISGCAAHKLARGLRQGQTPRPKRTRSRISSSLGADATTVLGVAVAPCFGTDAAACLTLSR